LILKTIIELSKDVFVAVCFIGICILVFSGIVGKVIEKILEKKE